MVELALRLVASLAVVVGLLLLLARLGARKFSGSSDGLVRVVHRQPLSRTSSLAVVDVAGRILVLGTTEHQVSLVTELDAVDLETAGHLETVFPSPRSEHAADDLDTLDPTSSTGSTRAVPAAALARRSERSTVVAGTGALGGSVLSPATWQAARQALGGRPGAGAPGGRRRAGGSRRAS